MKQHLAAALLALSIGCATVPPAERSQRALDRATALKQDSKLEAAAAAYEESLQADPGNLSSLRGLIEVHHRLGKLGALERRFSARVREAPGDALAHEALGLTLFARGGDRLPEARQELQTAAELAPGTADFHYRLGVLLVESDRFSDARAPLAKAVELDPNRPRYRLPYALTLARLGERAAAVAQLERVLQLDPSRDEVQLAEKTSRSLVDPFRGFPTAAREQFETALSYLEREGTREAQGLLEQLAERYPDLAIVQAMLGLCAAKADDAGRAISWLRKAIDLDPQLAEPRMYLGDLYFARGRPDTGREHYEAAVARNPFFADAHKRYAEVLLKLGDKEQAADRYRIYLLLRPQDYAASLAHAGLLSELKRPQAGAVWDDLVRSFPHRPEALVGRGRYYFQRALGGSSPDERAAARKKARESLETVVEMDPENATATAMLAELRLLK